ncbi:hypothetical protein PybrP1_007661 [[Pythium] brassicae (nom. inval.)]|nr:hypothetical protein PybrP1_007661 [[Pythium] brassicae (nom. inval.)]
MLVATLDYILVSRAGLHVQQVFPLYSTEDVSAEVALPSSRFPSDHISLVCDYLAVVDTGMKRRLIARTDKSGDTTSSSTDKRGCQIHPLGEDPSFQTLTPRSLARSVAELDALRSRVLALELQLSQNEMDAALKSAQHKSVAKKLPPIAPGAAAGGGGTASGGSSGADGTGGVDERPTTDDFAASSEAQSHHSPTRGSSNPPPAKRLSSSLSFTGLASVSASSPPREDTKITLGQDGGDAVFAVSKRNRLYQILKQVSALVPIKEDELVVLKKLVDAEIGDVIQFLVDLEHEVSPAVISEKLACLLETGSPSKHHSARAEQLPRQHPVWGIQYPLQKIARNLERLRSSLPPSGSQGHQAATGTLAAASPSSLSSSSSPSKRAEVIVLVASGAYNPIHMLHVRAFYVARQFVESNYKFPVVGAFFSPSHDTYVRAKNRVNPREMITKRHRLALLEAAVASSTWIEVDKWEITRRRVLDYLSTLTHVREMCDAHFPGFKFHVVYVCGCNTVVKLSHSALRDEGFGCITVCRPTQTEMVIKHLGKQLAKATTIVEDTGVLPCDLERATSFRVRKALADMEKNSAVIEMMVGRPVFQYFAKHDIGAKVAGKESWTDEDKHWRDVDLPYVEYVES